MRIASIILFLVIISAALIGQEKAAGKKPKEVRWQSDTLVGSDAGSGDTKEFIGHVNFWQGDVHLTSEYARQYVISNSALFTGNVVVTQEDLTLKSPRVTYFGNSGIANAYDGVDITDRNGRIIADSGSYSTETYIAYFMGACKVTDDTVTIWCDTVQYQRKTRVSYAYGNVKIVDDSVVIYADTVEHQREGRMSYASGRVKVVDDSVTILADFIEYDRSVRNSGAFGNVIIKGRDSKVKLFADTVYNKSNEKYTLGFGSPVLYQIDTVKTRKMLNSGVEDFTLDTMSISSDTMEIFQKDQDKYIFTGNVELVKGGISAIAELAVYDKKSEIITLTGSPIIWSDSTQLYGDSVIIYVPDNKLKRIQAYANALAVSRDDTLNPDWINQISGEEIVLYVDMDTIRSIRAYNNTKSLYFNLSDSGEDFANRSGADTIKIEFEKGELADIIWLGAVDGENYPEEFFFKDPKSLYLPKFKWTDLRPDKKSIDAKRWNRDYYAISLNDRIDISSNMQDNTILLDFMDFLPGVYNLRVYNHLGFILKEVEIVIDKGFIHYAIELEQLDKGFYFVGLFGKSNFYAAKSISITN